MLTSVRRACGTCALMPPYSTYSCHSFTHSFPEKILEQRLERDERMSHVDKQGYIASLKALKPEYDCHVKEKAGHKGG